MKVIIRPIRNGYIMDIDNEETPVETFVVEEPDEPLGEVEAFASLLHMLNEHIGPSTSRHSAKRVYIEVRPGDKHLDSAEE